MSDNGDYEFHAPPNWPSPPPGWSPPAGWQPDPAWGPAPEGWQFWQERAEPWSTAPGEGRSFTAPPSSDAGNNWFTRHKVVTGIAGAFLFLMFLGAVSGGGDEQSRQTEVNLASTDEDREPEVSAADRAAADQAAADKAAAEKAAADKAAAEKAAADKAAVEAAKKGPADQQAFLAAVVTGRQAFEDTDNELRQRQIQKTRDGAVCAAVPSRGVANWVGKIRSLDTNGEGKAVLELDIGDDTKVATWNNALSDSFDETLIPMESPMYETLVGLAEGDSVLFSGTFIDDNETCLGERSMTLQGQMRTPNFVFRFSDVVGR